MGEGGETDWSVVIPAHNEEREIPINWADQPDSKVSVLTDGPAMLWEILAARLSLARGRQER